MVRFTQVLTRSFDLVVIGGGSGGLACSKEAARLGKKVAVLDYVSPTPQGTKWDIGGTCVNVGCIPKKLMHQSALVGHSLKHAKSFGWMMEENVEHDWSVLSKAVQMYIRSLNWGYKVQLADKNVANINGKGSFIDGNNIEVTDRKGNKSVIYGDNIVVAVGGRPKYPEIDGVRECCISSDDIFWKNEPPGKTLVIGSSYVGLECAGFLNGLGIDTTLMIRSIPLRGFDQQIAHLITDHMTEEGLKIQWARYPTGFSKNVNGKVQVESKTDKNEYSNDIYDTVLLAIGREPSTQYLNLKNVGVETKDGKIIVNSHDQSNVESVYAIGDVALDRPELTPVAIKSGKLLARRLFGGSTELTDYKAVPTTVFTPLEYGCVGLDEETAMKQYGNDNIEIYHSFYKPLEYALTDQNAKQCYVKVVAERDPNKPILGVHFLGPNAGEVTQGFAVALRCGMTYNQLISTIGIHPTCAEEIIKLNITKRSGDDPTVTGC